VAVEADVVTTGALTQRTHESAEYLNLADGALMAHSLMPSLTQSRTRAVVTDERQLIHAPPSLMQSPAPRRRRIR
jgi:hypothetical protein